MLRSVGGQKSYAFSVPQPRSGEPESGWHGATPSSLRRLRKLVYVDFAHDAGVRDQDLDLEGGERCAAIHAHDDVVAIDRDMLAQRRKDLFAQDADQIGLPVCAALV